jgi:hypothetical protein
MRRTSSTSGATFLRLIPRAPRGHGSSDESSALRSVALACEPLSSQ